MLKQKVEWHMARDCQRVNVLNGLCRCLHVWGWKAPCSCYTSSQHNAVGQSRKDRDHKDTNTFLTVSENRSPLCENPLLSNIEIGVTLGCVNAHQVIKCYRWHCYIYDTTNPFEIAFKRNKKAVTLDATQQTKADNDMIMKVDPQLLHLY